MYNTRVRIAIAGAGGRMGKILIQSTLSMKHVVLSAAIESKNSLFLGSDVGDLIGLKKTGIIIQDSLSVVKNYFDILIDFTSPEGTLDHLKFCQKHKKSMVIGTTGFKNKEKKKYIKLQMILLLFFLIILVLV